MLLIMSDVVSVRDVMLVLCNVLCVAPAETQFAVQYITALRSLPRLRKSEKQCENRFFSLYKMYPVTWTNAGFVKSLDDVYLL